IPSRSARSLSVTPCPWQAYQRAVASAPEAVASASACRQRLSPAPATVASASASLQRPVVVAPARSASAQADPTPNASATRQRAGGTKVVFTGISIYGIDPHSQHFISHKDVWDSIKDNDYFSQEGLRDLVKQMMMLYSPPAQLNSPQFNVLLRRASYEVREYPTFQVLQLSSLGQSTTDIWPSAHDTPPIPQVEKLRR
ncbi:unnamed protein product, partial [Closterium sp. NIES-53]